MIIGNLISNACKYSSDRKVKVVLDDRYLSVSNLSDGISSEDLDSLFNPYTRGKNSQKSNGKGLGLSVVKDLVEMHGWRLEYGLSKEGVFGIKVVFL
jgi:signal transduction histidine kinase